MGQTRDETTRNLAERLWWEVAHRDDARVARRLYRKQVMDGVYRLDAGALLEVVGMTGLTTDDPYGTPAHGRQHHCRDFQGNPINAVVVRK